MTSDGMLRSGFVCVCPDLQHKSWLSKMDAWGLQATPSVGSEPMFKGSKLLESVRG